MAKMSMRQGASGLRRGTCKLCRSSSITGREITKLNALLSARACVRSGWSADRALQLASASRSVNRSFSKVSIRLRSSGAKSGLFRGATSPSICPLIIAAVCPDSCTLWAYFEKRDSTIRDNSSASRAIFLDKRLLIRQTYMSTSSSSDSCVCFSACHAFASFRALQVLPASAKPRMDSGQIDTFSVRC
ncbi:MAG: hypothetical protein BWY09_02213 [Candidatus Hydrogenedentes bacterium ADurb.Bin179]|nr:MAG: hypothetical protein BWY09_02213 [Candidatus Hydrogenedentes bacterium ADurb.Bin179]